MNTQSWLLIFRKTKTIPNLRIIKFGSYRNQKSYLDLPFWIRNPATIGPNQGGNKVCCNLYQNCWLLWSYPTRWYPKAEKGYQKEKLKYCIQTDSWEFIVQIKFATFRCCRSQHHYFSHKTPSTAPLVLVVMLRHVIGCYFSASWLHYREKHIMKIW